jgi:hypothetical protein
MAQQTKLSKNNTKVSNVEGYTVITLHGTDIVKFSDNIIILNHGGFVTSTTKTRMTQASRTFELGYSVFSKNGKMFVSYEGLTLPVESEIVLIRK